MALIDGYLAEAGKGAIIMAAEEGLADLRANTPADQWDGLSYRSARVELHDEWSWGWMVRRADGSMVEGVPGD